MNAMILRVVKQGEPFSVQSQKSENGQMMKCNIVLQELGGKYENQYAAAMLGNAAQCKFYPGDLVVATLRFTAREYNGQVYQDILVTDIEKVKKEKGKKNFAGKDLRWFCNKIINLSWDGRRIFLSKARNIPDVSPRKFQFRHEEK